MGQQHVDFDREKKESNGPTKARTRGRSREKSSIEIDRMTVDLRFDWHGILCELLERNIENRMLKIYPQEIDVT